jgi:hypothetical protein
VRGAVTTVREFAICGSGLASSELTRRICRRDGTVAAADITVPVLIALGERDLAVHPHAETSAYSG